MNNNDRSAIFQAQVENRQEIERAWKHVKRSINSDLKKNSLISARVHTKTLTLVYCAWAEASFSQLIHTPNGFTLAEISLIKAEQRKSIVDAWELCIRLALKKVSSSKSNHIPNVQKRLTKLVAEHIADPSLVRNKIAHGQWVSALNRANTALNAPLSLKIQELNIVQLDILKEAFSGLSKIVVAMIQSPNKAFHRDYWTLITEIEEHLRKTARHTLEDKVALLKSKADRRHPRTS
jgi:hypothetical protein